jgi:hypothetical protein
MESTASSRHPLGRPTDQGEVAATPPSTEILGDTDPAREPNGSTDWQVCPYCGLVRARSEAVGACPRCTIEDSPQTRQATKARIGPWYVLQTRNPAAPGMKWSTLLALVKKGQVTPRSVVRGPTTHQLWRLAAQVKGLSREFGLCYSCGLEIARTTNQCPHCDRLQEPPANPDALLESRESSGRRATMVAPIEVELPQPPGAIVTERREPRPDQGLLTARELATAFSLGVPTSDGAAAPASAVPVRRRRHVGAVAILFVLALLGAWVWVTPAYRAAAVQYWETGRDWAIARWQAWQAPDAPPVVQAVESSADAPAVNAKGESVGARAAGRDSEPQAQVDTRDSPPVMSAPVVVDPAALAEQARSLRRSAIDAEAAGDFARAVRLYEQIRALPRDCWPSDLHVRLDAAKQRLN